MSTFLQLLRLAFWINPLQRMLTCVGVVGLVAVGILILARVPTHSAWFWPLVRLYEMSFLAPVTGLLMCGLYWRTASASRIVRLAPHGRRRLLGSVLGLVLLVASLWSAPNWLNLLLWMDPKFHPSAAMMLVEVVHSAAVLGLAIVGVFIASRSPMAALLLLGVLILPIIADWLHVDPFKHLSRATREVTVLALIWIPFAIWYLTARRISRPQWFAGGSGDVVVTTLVSSTRPQSRSEALQRQLLGGTTIIRFGVQWFVILGLVLAAIWVPARLSGESDPKVVATLMYASICICPVATTAVSLAAIRRSRSLWLLTASTRAEFFICVRGILNRLNLVMALVFAVWLTVVWLMWPDWRPGSTGEAWPTAFCFTVLWTLGLFAIHSQLAGWPRWPGATVGAGVLISIAWLCAISPAGSTNGATALAAAILLISAWIATFVLQRAAQRRWGDGDLPRAVAALS